MGRLTKNHILEIGIGVFVLGLVLTALAWTNAYSATPMLDWYDALLARIPGQGEAGDYNVLLMVVGPIVLITGAWYAGEQIILRRRFARLMDTSKRSEFVSRRKDLDALARRLPREYKKRIDEKEASLRSAR